eukprot:6934416-Lingulodinium_polyedra.AAC.1
MGTPAGAAVEEGATPPAARRTVVTTCANARGTEARQNARRNLRRRRPDRITARQGAAPRCQDSAGVAG